MSYRSRRPWRRLPVLLACVAASACSSYGDSRVQTGLDVIQQSSFLPLLRGNVGLITNHTSIDASGQSSIEVLFAAPDVRLATVFSPEHGIAGKLDIADISDGIEASTGIPIISLYGDNRRPTASMLSNIDVLVFDIQDIGTRFYTYISTMGYAMQAAAEHGVRFVVLDRPNPINGVDIAGPMLDDGLQSFVGFHMLPVRHGMTVGELASLFKAELKLNLDLQIVAMQHWRREQFFDATGLHWVNPSPNMRSLNAALLYPGIGLLETTNLSVGRGTDTPFEVLGAPWLDGERLARDLNEIGFDGVRIEAVRFTPGASKFADEACNGIRITVADRNAVEPIRLGLTIARILVLDYPDLWDTSNYLRLLGNRASYADISGGKPMANILRPIIDDAARFRLRRQPFLLYD